MEIANEMKRKKMCFRAFSFAWLYLWNFFFLVSHDCLYKSTKKKNQKKKHKNALHCANMCVCVCARWHLCVVNLATNLFVFVIIIKL